MWARTKGCSTVWRPSRAFSAVWRTRRRVAPGRRSKSSTDSAESIAQRVELARAAEAELEALYLRVIARAPSQSAAWFNGLERLVTRKVKSGLDQIASEVDQAIDVRPRYLSFGASGSSSGRIPPALQRLRRHRFSR